MAGEEPRNTEQSELQLYLKLSQSLDARREEERKAEEDFATATRDLEQITAELMGILRLEVTTTEEADIFLEFHHRNPGWPGVVVVNAAEEGGIRDGIVAKLEKADVCFNLVEDN